VEVVAALAFSAVVLEAESSAVETVEASVAVVASAVDVAVETVADVEALVADAVETVEAAEDVEETVEDAEDALDLVATLVPVPRSLSSPIVMKVSLSPKERRTSSAPSTLFLESLSTERSVSLLILRTEPRPSTVSGTLSAPSSLLPSSEELRTLTSSPVPRSFTSVLPLVPLSHTFLISLDAMVLYMLLSSRTVLDAIS
jgi:hypothetical protein